MAVPLAGGSGLPLERPRPFFLQPHLTAQIDRPLLSIPVRRHALASLR